MQNYSETHPSTVLTCCPRCGQQGFEFDNKKMFFCKACNFNFYINPAAAVTAILESTDGKIVLTKRKYEPRSGFYDLPGGFVDIMERAEDALKREVLEELGIKIDRIKFLTSFPNDYVFKGISYFTCDIAFVCPIEDLSGLKPADDVSGALIINPGDINFKMISFPSIVNILKYYIENNL
jgi:NAD+ diphosphatase